MHSLGAGNGCILSVSRAKNIRARLCGLDISADRFVAGGKSPAIA